jgi:hypothetical protein
MKKNTRAIARISFWCTAALLGFSHAWWSRMTMGGDTISYLDMGDYFLKGEWSTALNSQWSPLYAGLLKRQRHQQSLGPQTQQGLG